MARWILASGGTVTFYRQKTSIAQNFDGEAPTNEFNEAHADVGVFDDGIWDVPADSVGNHAGLFRHGHVFPLKIKEIRLKLDVAISSWFLYIIRKDLTSFVFISGSSGGDIFLSEMTDELPTIRPGEKIKFVTNGTPTGVSECSIGSQYENR